MRVCIGILGHWGKSLMDGGGMLAGHEECAGEAVGQLSSGSCFRVLGSWGKKPNPKPKVQGFRGLGFWV